MTTDDNGTCGTAVEVANAAREVARTGSEALAVAEKVGAFLSAIVEGPLEQLSGIVTDRLKYVRWERSVRLVDRAQAFMDQRGGRMVPRQVPLNVAIPVFEAASLEEDDHLQDVWAALLVNAADASSGVEIKRAFVSILQDFSAMEVQLLQAIYDAPGETGVVWTSGLPDCYAGPDEDSENPKLPEVPVQIGLWQLMRLGCITEGGTWGSIAGIQGVRITALGRALVEACSAAAFRNGEETTTSE